MLEALTPTLVTGRMIFSGPSPCDLQALSNLSRKLDFSSWEPSCGQKFGAVWGGGEGKEGQVWGTWTRGAPLPRCGLLWGWPGQPRTSGDGPQYRRAPALVRPSRSWSSACARWHALVVGLQDPPGCSPPGLRRSSAQGLQPLGPRHGFSRVQGLAGAPGLLERAPHARTPAGPPAALYRPGPPLLLWGQLWGSHKLLNRGSPRVGLSDRVHLQLMVYSRSCLFCRHSGVRALCMQPGAQWVMLTAQPYHRV